MYIYIYIYVYISIAKVIIYFSTKALFRSYVTLMSLLWPKIDTENQLTGFYMRAILAFNGLRR